MKNFLLTSTLALAATALPELHGRHGGDQKCLTTAESDTLLKAYISAYEGITDGGAAVNKTFTEDFTLFSQSTWWISDNGNGFKSLFNQFPVSTYLTYLRISVALSTSPLPAACTLS
jgi:hypothetical protein